MCDLANSYIRVKEMIRGGGGEREKRTKLEKFTMN